MLWLFKQRDHEARITALERAHAEDKALMLREYTAMANRCASLEAELEKTRHEKLSGALWELGMNEAFEAKKRAVRESA